MIRRTRNTLSRDDSRLIIHEIVENRYSVFKEIVLTKLKMEEMK